MRVILFLCALSAIAGTPELFVAIRNGDAKAVKTQLRDPSLKDAPNADGLTPLMYAVLTAGTPVMRALLDSGVSVNAATADGVTALHIAAYDFDKTRLLVDRGASVEVLTKAGESPLLVAAARPGTAKIVSLLLSKGARPNARALGRAATSGDIQLMRLLLANGATVTGTPGLARAAAFGHCRECLALALDGGADPNGATSVGRSALQDAAAFGDIEMVRMLVKREQIATPLTSAAIRR